MDNDEFLRRERQADARRREAFLKQQEKNDMKFTESGSTHAGMPLVKGEIGSTFRSRLSDLGSKFKEAMPKRMTDEELEVKIKKTHKKAELAEAEARLAKAKSRKSRSGGGFSSAGRVYKEVTDAFSQLPIAQGYGDGAGLGGYLSNFDPSPQPQGKRARRVAQTDEYDMSAYLSNFTGGPAPRKSKRKNRRSDDVIGQYFY